MSDSPGQNVNGQPESQSRKPVGPVIGTAIILVLLILGGLYFWGAHLNRTQNPPPLILGNDTQTNQRQ